MKYISLLFLTVCFSFYVQAQTTQGETADDVKNRQQFFAMKYLFTHYAMYEMEDTTKKGTRTLQVMKNEIKDTIKPFFNSITVNAQTLAKPIADLKAKSEVGHLFNSAFFSEGKDVKAFEGKVNLDVTNLPYRTYMQIFSNVTSVTDESGKSLLVQGKDTILDTWAGYKSGSQSFNTVKFKYDNTDHPAKINVSGTVTIKVPTKFLIVSFTPAEKGVHKAFQQYIFTLNECAAGKVIVTSNSYTSKSGIDVIPVGPSNVRYKKDQEHLMGGTVYTDEFVFNLAKNNPKQIPTDSLYALYFDQYEHYLKTGPVKSMTIYSDLYKGNIQKVYIIKPIEYYTITESFSLTSK